MSLQKNKDLLLSFFLPVLCFGMVTILVFLCAGVSPGIKILGSFCVSMILFACINARYLRKKKDAAAALKNKDSYTHLSHALRTPLATICGIAELLEATQENLDNRQRSLVSMLSASAATIKKLIIDSNKV